MDAVAEIKNRIPIEELVGQYVQLKKVGRNFKALCPFHNERTPSFYVSTERQLAYCFGCHKGGDHFKFIQEVEGLDFVGALKFLAERARVELPKMMPQHSPEQLSQKARLIEIHEAAAAYFEKNLQTNQDSAKLLDYIRRRGLTDETVAWARIGFAPDSRDALYRFLLEKGYGKDEIITSGLVMARDTEASECVDRFRMRLMFPIKNATGSVAAFGGRAIRAGDEPKYLNSPETPIFHKSTFLYGLTDARNAIRAHDSVVLVEGYMDAVTVHQAGIENVVACSGTALTTDQLTILKRFTPNLILSFDQDNAGKQATLRAIEMAIGMDFTIKVAVWEGEAKDPDELVRSAPHIYKAALNDAQPVTTYLLNAMEAKHIHTSEQGSSSQSKRKIVEELVPFFAKVQNAIELDEWLKECSVRLEVSLQALYDEIERYKQRKASSFAGPRATASQRSPQQPTNSQEQKIRGQQEYFLGLLLTCPDLNVLANQLVPLNFLDDPELQNIYTHLTSDYNNDLGEAESKRRSILELYGETLFKEISPDAARHELKEVATVLARAHYERQKRSLLSRLKSLRGEEEAELLTAYQELLAQERSYGQKA